MRVAALGLLAAAALSACVVVPVDPRTGQPWPPQAPPPHGGGATAPLPMPPAPAAPAATVLQARLYPLNDVAGQAGLVWAQVTDGHGGRGSITMSYRGQALQGEATRVDSGYAGFGRVHEQVFGPARRDFSGRRGVANAFGTGSAGALSAQCEYVITSGTGGGLLGTGACLFSDGAKYQLHFGP